MRPGAEAYIRHPLPIGGIVLRLSARQRPVGNLVMHITGSLQAAADHFVLPGAELLRSLGEPAVRGHHRKVASLLDAQLIGGHVLRPQPADTVERVGKHLPRQLRQTEYEVQAHVLHPGIAKNAEGPAGGCGVVAPPHPAQDAVVERLHAHADAVHPELQQLRHVCASLLRDVLRIHLDRELVERSAAQRPDDALKRRRRQHRRRTSSEIKRIDPEGPGCLLPAGGNLGAESAGVAFDLSGIPPPARDFRIEVAVDAETSAEGDVDVDHYLSISSAEPSSDCSV